MNIVVDIFSRAFLILMCAGSVVGVLIGAGLLFKPTWILSLNQQLSRWVSTRKIEVHLDRPRWTERFFYRHHRVTGAVLVLGGVFIFITFMFRYNTRKISAAFAPRDWWLWDGLLALLLLGSVVAALVGAIMLTKPSLLRDIETTTNRWISTEGLMKFFHTMHHSTDQFILRHRRVAGALIIVGSVYILVVLGPMLWRGGWRF